MSASGATPLFVDTSAFYAWAAEGDKHHETVTRIFEEIRSEELVFRPIYTSQAVLAELATLCLRKLGHEHAVRILTTVRQSESINVIPIGRSAFAAAANQFAAYDDQLISFVDHTTAVLADEREVDHVFTFDSDFRTLDFSLVPADIGVL